MSTTSKNGNKRKTILFVEDEVQMLELGKDLMEAHGYRVFLAKDGYEAIEIYKEKGGEIDLVILDVMLPEMDGRQTYFELKKMNSSLKAFFCTGFASLGEIQSLLEDENLHAVQKPFVPSEFIAIVKELLEEE